MQARPMRFLPQPRPGGGGAMPGRAKYPVPKAPDLREAAQALAQGRELVKQAQRLREEAGRQIEGGQATIEQADRALNRANQILGDKAPSRAPSPTGSSPGDAEA